MVIGVVPRYDPHGMGLPLVPRPGAVGIGAAGSAVPAGGRQRAATASSLDPSREVGYRCCCSHTDRTIIDYCFIPCVLPFAPLVPH